MIWTIFMANKRAFNQIFTVIHPINHLWKTEVFYCINADGQVMIDEYAAPWKQSKTLFQRLYNEISKCPKMPQLICSCVEINARQGGPLRIIWVH